MMLLVLRPAAGAAATALRARNAGHDAVVAPLFHYRAMPWTAPDPGEVDAVLLTSAAAARFGGDALTGYYSLPVQAVGSATAAAAIAAGFSSVTAGDKDARAAVDALASRGHRIVLHPAGLDHIAIAHPGLTILRRQVYAADAVDALSDIAISALDQGAIALLHSPRAADVFRRLLNVADHPSNAIRIGCFSPAVAAHAGSDWAGIAVADRPTDDALFAAVAMLCDQQGDEPRERR